MMITRDIIQHRLVNQQIADTTLKTPQQVVEYLGAVQAQEYNQSKWAIGLRLPEGITDADVENAFTEGKILRTHVLRPTWHYVSPNDIRWIQGLTAHRVHAFNAFMYRKLELDDKTLQRCRTIMVKLLEGKNYVTREAINREFEKQKIKADGLRLAYIVMHAELDAIICSGPRQGKQFTYALVDERAPLKKPFVFDRVEALFKLTEKYFATRGPATVNDYTWWSGLTVKEAKEGIAMLGNHFVREKINEKEHIYVDANPGLTAKSQTTFLMPDYDEYGISYKDRSAAAPPPGVAYVNPQQPNTYYHILVADGMVAGTWRRNVKNHANGVEINIAGGISKTQQAAIAKALKRYVAFMDEPEAKSKATAKKKG